MTRTEAKTAGIKRYHGAVCAKHPLLKGLRYVSNCRCSGCANDSSKLWGKTNPEKRRAINEVWRAANPARVKANEANWRYRRLYGISKEQKETLVQQQSGRCACCGETLITACVDHCHVGGDVRGVLCRHCNSMLGYAQDNPLRLARGMDYLRKHSAVFKS